LLKRWMARACAASSKSQKPDLIVLDVVLPDADGRKLLAALKQEPKTADIPVLLWSARYRDSESDIALDLGAEEFFRKGADRRAGEQDRAHPAAYQRAHPGGALALPRRKREKNLAAKARVRALTRGGDARSSESPLAVWACSSGRARPRRAGPTRRLPQVSVVGGVATVGGGSGASADDQRRRRLPKRAPARQAPARGGSAGSLGGAENQWAALAAARARGFRRRWAKLWGLPQFPAALAGLRHPGGAPARRSRAGREPARLLERRPAVPERHRPRATASSPAIGLTRKSSTPLLDGVERTGALHYRGLVGTFYDGSRRARAGSSTTTTTKRG